METAKWITKDPSISEHDLLDPFYNFWVASLYYRYQLSRYNDNRSYAISAYNAGSYRSHNKAYVKKVFERMKLYGNRY